MSRPGLLPLMTSRRFLPLFITQFLESFVDNSCKHAFFIWLTYDLAEKSGLNAGMTVTVAAGLFVAPFFLFSATAGQVADKIEKSQLIRSLLKIQVVLTMLCCACFFLGYVYLLIGILFVMTVSTTFFGPVKYSILPDHLKDDELMAGNSLIEAGTFLSILLGAIFGGLTIRMPHGIEFFTCCVIASSIAGWIFSRFIPLSEIDDPKLHISRNILSETYRIIRHARHERIVWLSVIGISWFWLCGGVFLTQLPNFTKNIIGGDEQVNMLWLVIFSLGIAAGSLACSKIQGTAIHGRLVPYGLAGVTLGVLCFVSASIFYDSANAFHMDMLIGLHDFLALGPVSWCLIASLLFLSFCGGIYIVPLYVMMQHYAPHQYRSRVIAANNILNAFFMVMASVGVFLLYALGLDIVDIFFCLGLLNIPLYIAIRSICRKTSEPACSPQPHNSPAGENRQG